MKIIKSEDNVKFAQEVDIQRLADLIAEMGYSSRISIIKAVGDDYDEAIEILKRLGEEVDNLYMTLLDRAESRQNQTLMG